MHSHTSPHPSWRVTISPAILDRRHSRLIRGGDQVPAGQPKPLCQHRSARDPGQLLTPQSEKLLSLFRCVYAKGMPTTCPPTKKILVKTSRARAPSNNLQKLRGKPPIEATEHPSGCEWPRVPTWWRIRRRAAFAEGRHRAPPGPAPGGWKGETLSRQRDAIRSRIQEKAIVED